MEFKMTNRYMKNIQSTFTEDNPPWWLVSQEFLWWWKDHVLTLGVGESIKSDFQEIQRVA